MAQKTEKLDEQIHIKLSVLQNDINESVINVGQLTLQIRDVKREMERLEELLQASQQKFDSSNLEINTLLSELEQKYPTGEIDLKDGIITYEENQ
jgi:archaellum component FlaC